MLFEISKYDTLIACLYTRWIEDAFCQEKYKKNIGTLQYGLNRA
jgi:hypothetical protein